ncbi:RNA polymerase Rpb7-like [Theobroma cacao]|nr:RNA polymerase Rpb7-like [Theobroma cacao]
MLIQDMFSEVELQRDVKVHAGNLDKRGLVSQRSILVLLLEDLFKERASEDHGYFLSVTSLKSIGKGDVVDESGNMVFTVVFTCRTFKPFKGEVLQGVVHHICHRGVFLRCGPVRIAYLSAWKMPNYHYVPGAKPVFISDDLSKIQKDVVVCFLVLAVRWISASRDFELLASLNADSLGPISLPWSDEVDL